MERSSSRIKFKLLLQLKKTLKNDLKIHTSTQTGSAGLTCNHSAMAAFENQFGPITVTVFICIVIQLFTLFVSVVQAVQSLSPKTGVSGSYPG